MSFDTDYPGHENQQNGEYREVADQCPCCNVHGHGSYDDEMIKCRAEGETRQLTIAGQAKRIRREEEAMRKPSGRSRKHCETLRITRFCVSCWTRWLRVWKQHGGLHPWDAVCYMLVSTELDLA